jgi:hypothetical protein
MTTRKGYENAYIKWTVNGRNAKINFTALEARMYAAPVNIKSNLYRVTSPSRVNQLLKNGFIDNKGPASFTYNKNFANYHHKTSSNKNSRYFILGPGRYPGINSTRNYGSAFPYEKEVTIAPGRYILTGITKNGHLKVAYIPKQI